MRRLVGIVFGVFVALAAASCGSPLVGGECREGFGICEGRCVDLSTDVRNCGACGESCGTGLVCDEGECRSASTSDGGVDASDDGDVDGGQPNPMGCALGEALCDGVCVRPIEDGENCGGCGIVCEGVCANGVCEGSCDEPLLECGNICISPEVHPNHCGDCFSPCASGVCRRGECVEASAGHVVVIGHDYRGVPSGRQAINRVLGNAVYLADGVPIRVLAYQEYTHAASVTGVERALEQVRVERGRPYEVETATQELVPFRLEQADVLLILAQHAASDTILRQIGAAWGRALSDFVTTGGVIVLLDGEGGNDGTFQILDEAGLFTASETVSLPSSSLEVTNLGAALAVGLPEMYGVEESTVRFVTDETEVIVRHATGPVVIHRIVRR